MGGYAKIQIFIQGITRHESGLYVHLWPLKVMSTYTFVKISTVSDA